MNEKSDRAKREEEVLKFWQDNKIFEKTLEKKSPKGEFVFYDGPPFATGLPHYGSLLSSIVKDVIPRYKTMQGYHVRRRWGWDCHGLPIENMVEKELGLKDKKEIEAMGVAKFNRACRDSVLRFVHEWKKFVDRVGRFVDFDNSYKTMDNSYIESVWWFLKQIHDKELLYEGRKVLLYCPHCETPLAKAEVAMDQSYKDVNEESVYVKFPIIGFENAYFLAWTTTPWTLPGNVALAVGKDIDYVEAKVGEEILVLAKSRLSILTEPYEIIAEHKGSEMVGMQYEPLYEISKVKESGKKSHYIAEADFVTTEDGTGIVHTAVIYGEDDYNLGLKLDLPMVPLLDSAAHFTADAPEFIRGEYYKKAGKMVTADLESRNRLFRKEMHTHSYPHCHRCGTALIYNALTSWFIDIQKIKSRMIELNEKVNWAPDHLKHGRFLNIVENAPDWTISRNRYWAAPLPIWKDQQGKVYLIDSLETLKKHTKKSGNKYFVMRHGEADHNVRNVLDLEGDPNVHLTERGREQVGKAKTSEPDLVFCSPFPRSKETASIIKKEFAVDERLREMHPEETDENMKRRLMGFMFEIEQKYQNKTIVIVSHQGPVRALSGITLDTAEIAPYEFAPFPHNENFELDLHRPYIDEVELVTEDGAPLKRIPEVIDGWVESGSMTFAEYHYPFENEGEFKKNFPGDFIAEYIAQTRTWFYYMHAVAVALFDNISFKNVLTTGTILAEDGSKMSKSKGNFTDPLILIDKYGADALRYYLMSSVVMQAEDIRFSDDEVRQVHNQLLNILWNSYRFYEMYGGDKQPTTNNQQPKHILDEWILERLEELTEEVTEALESYNTVGAARPVRDFVSDFSTWYVRRSRDRFKSDDMADRQSALYTTRHVLMTLSKLLAPVTPFVAEDIYRNLRAESDPESVHLCEWPKTGFKLKVFSSKVTEDMAETRRLVSLALDERQKANIKVRQPLSKLEVKKLEVGEEYLELIKDEVNVREVVENSNLDTEVKLDTTITPELKEEGEVRELIREIQDARKEKNLKPVDRFEYQVPSDKSELAKRNEAEISKATNSVLSYLHD